MGERKQTQNELDCALTVGESQKLNQNSFDAYTSYAWHLLSLGWQACFVGFDNSKGTSRDLKDWISRIGVMRGGVDLYVGAGSKTSATRWRVESNNQSPKMLQNGVVLGHSCWLLWTSIAAPSNWGSGQKCRIVIWPWILETRENEGDGRSILIVLLFISLQQ